MTNPPTVLAFAASNSTQSINRRLAIHAGAVLQSELRVDLRTLDLNDFEMPIFSPDREKDGIPDQAHEFFAQLGSADGLIISLAEYNGSYTSAFKNIFDWTSRIKMRVFQDKPTLLLATSIGSRGGQNVMKAALGGFPHFGASVTSSFLFGPFSEHFGDEGLTTPAMQTELRAALATFAAALPSHSQFSKGLDYADSAAS